jgi:hypothetical protein
MCASPGAEWFLLDRGSIVDLRDGPHPTLVLGHAGGETELPDGSTHFIVVYDGVVNLTVAFGSYAMRPGQHAAIPGRASLSGSGHALIVSRLGYLGMFTLGGPIEPLGRLKYIDGCSDTVLIGPILRGDPCLNMLHVPPAVDQTEHTHPSVRVGIVISGNGRCVTPDHTLSLVPGGVFVLHPDAPHSFHTDVSPLQIVVYHPDSDTGPSHDDHPMLNRSIVGGRSAADLPNIRTTQI